MDLGPVLDSVATLKTAKAVLLRPSKDACQSFLAFLHSKFVRLGGGYNRWMIGMKRDGCGRNKQRPIKQVGTVISFMLFLLFGDQEKVLLFSLAGRVDSPCRMI